MSKDKEIYERVRLYLEIIDENIERAKEQQSKSSDIARRMFFCGEEDGFKYSRFYLESLLEEFDCDNC